MVWGLSVGCHAYFFVDTQRRRWRQKKKVMCTEKPNCDTCEQFSNHFVMTNSENRERLMGKPNTHRKIITKTQEDGTNLISHQKVP